MKLREAFLYENARTDYEQRARADKAFNDLIAAVKRLRGFDGMSYSPQSDAYVAQEYKLRHPEVFSLVLRNKAKESRKDGGFVNRTLNLWVYFDQDLVDQIKRLRVVIIHELIHLFDSERMKVMQSTADLPDEEYFNHPVETNAYYQEAVSKLEDTFSKLPPDVKRRQLERLQDFDQFLSLVNTMMSDSFTTWVNAKTDQKIKKRLYQYWYQAIRGRA